MFAAIDELAFSKKNADTKTLNVFFREKFHSSKWDTYDLWLNDNIFNQDTLEIFLDKQIRACDDRNLAYVYSAGDVFSFGMSSTMDIYTGMYRYAYMSKNYNMITSGTSINPFHMRHTGLWELRIPRADGRFFCLPVVPRLSLRPYKQQLNDGEWVNTRWEEITKYSWADRIENKHENWHP